MKRKVVPLRRLLHRAALSAVPEWFIAHVNGCKECAAGWEELCKHAEKIERRR